MLSDCTVPPDSKETKLGSSNKTYLHQQVKTHGSVSLQLFPVVWIFMRSLGVPCYDR